MPPAADNDQARGRRQGEPVSREVVLAAAKTPLRPGRLREDDAARDRDATPASTRRWCCTCSARRSELFRESLRLVIDPEVLVRALTGADEEGDIGDPHGAHVPRGSGRRRTARRPCAAMLQSATSNPDANEAFRSFMQNYVLTAVSGVLGGDEHARLRAMLAASSLVGTAMLRYVMAGAAAGDTARRRRGQAGRADRDAVPDR